MSNTELTGTQSQSEAEVSPSPVIDPAFAIGNDVLASATNPSELDPEGVEPPSNEELALRIAEIRGEFESLKAAFEKLCAALNVR